MHLLDISSRGARAYALEAPVCGASIIVECKTPLGLACVSWSDGKNFGLQFLVPITSGTIDQIAETLGRGRGG